MREILFRGKRVDNGEWVEGNYLKRWTGASYKHYIHDGLYDIEVIPETVGQYTGLKDKNGKMIFEGDIVKWEEKEWGSAYSEVVTWDYELLSIRKNDWSQWCEIIGNIHDNPELIIKDE